MLLALSSNELCFSFQWLANEALMNNPKLEVINGNSFIFKPVYRIKDGKSLLKWVECKYFSSHAHSS